MSRTFAAFALGFCRQHDLFARSFGIYKHGTPLVTATRLRSTFQAPEPPQSKGNAIYEDIVVGDIQSTSGLKRNSDNNAFFVVNGASRGIGLQFVKSLMDRTKVSHDCFELSFLVLHI